MRELSYPSFVQLSGNIKKSLWLCYEKRYSNYTLHRIYFSIKFLFYEKLFKFILNIMMEAGQNLIHKCKIYKNNYVFRTPCIFSSVCQQYCWRNTHFWSWHNGHWISNFIAVAARVASCPRTPRAVWTGMSAWTCPAWTEPPASIWSRGSGIGASARRAIGARTASWSRRGSASSWAWAPWGPYSSAWLSYWVSTERHASATGPLICPKECPIHVWQLSGLSGNMLPPSAYTSTPPKVFLRSLFFHINAILAGAAPRKTTPLTSVWTVESVWGPAKNKTSRDEGSSWEIREFLAT